MNKVWNVLAGIVIAHVLLTGAGWLMGKIDFATYLDAIKIVVLPAMGYFMAFMPKAGQ